MLIGLTGGIGSGKSTVLKLFQNLGAATLSSDQLIHQLTAVDQPVTQSIINHFGQAIVDITRNCLDRAAIRQLIFSDPIQRKWLEDLLHPLVKTEIQSYHAKFKTGWLIVEIPLLIEANMTHEVNRVLVVDCDETDQIQRVLKREQENRQANISLSLLQSIIHSQVSRETRISQADDIINNRSTLKALNEQVHEHFRYYNKLFN